MCKGCNRSYTGQTKQYLERRMLVHKRDENEHTLMEIKLLYIRTLIRQAISLISIIQTYFVMEVIGKAFIFKNSINISADVSGLSKIYHKLLVP